ncbi:hypothetical protein L208DRAFT_677682 [Tricholoma matsutake]|nr:hypothetical protein L208DRAFT_677682 [Tricholoma matsutake 945]
MREHWEARYFKKAESTLKKLMEKYWLKLNPNDSVPDSTVLPAPMSIFSDFGKYMFKSSSTAQFSGSTSI